MAHSRISPDHQWIAFVNVDDELIVESISDGTQSSFGIAGFPVWTPGSDWIVYSKLVDDQQVGLYATQPDGSSIQEILSGGTALVFGGSISPDGNTLAPTSLERATWSAAKSLYR